LHFLPQELFYAEKPMKFIGPKANLI